MTAKKKKAAKKSAKKQAKKLTKRQQAAKLERSRMLKRERDRRYREAHREEKRARDREYQRKRREAIRTEKTKPKPKHGDNRGPRTKDNGGTVEIRWKHRILIGGPADRESELRERLRGMLLTSLERCEMFTASGLAERYADQIADEVPFVAVEGAPPIVRLDSVDVLYANPPNGWKWWSRIRGGSDTIDPGDWA